MGHYIGIVNRRADRFVITFPDIAGCMATGKNLEEALREGREVLDQHLSDMAFQGREPPQASTLDMVLGDPRHSGGAPVLVPAPPVASASVRVTLALPEDALQAIDTHAEARGQTRSEFLVDATRAMIRSQDQVEAAVTEAARAEAGRAVIDLWGSGDRRTSSFLARMRTQTNRSHGMLGRTADGRAAPLTGAAQEEFRRFFDQTMQAAAHLQQRVANLEAAEPPIAIPKAGNDR